MEILESDGELFQTYSQPEKFLILTEKINYHTQSPQLLPNISNIDDFQIKEEQTFDYEPATEPIGNNEPEYDSE